MKISNIPQDQLKTVINVLIALYDCHAQEVNEDLKLAFRVEPREGSYKVTFSYLIGGEQVCVDEETNSFETKGVVEDTERFTILLSEDVIKLEQYVNETLDAITKQRQLA